MGVFENISEQDVVQHLVRLFEEDQNNRIQNQHLICECDSETLQIHQAGTNSFAVIQSNKIDISFIRRLITNAPLELIHTNCDFLPRKIICYGKLHIVSGLDSVQRNVEFYIKNSAFHTFSPGAYVFGNFENCIFHITDLDRESTFEAEKCHFENVKIVGFNTVRMEPSRITTFEEFIEGLKHNVVCGAQISEARNIVITQYEMLDGERCKYRFDAMHDSIISKIGVLPKAKHVGHWWVTEIR